MLLNTVWTLYFPSWNNASKSTWKSWTNNLQIWVKQVVHVKVNNIIMSLTNQINNRLIFHLQCCVASDLLECEAVLGFPLRFDFYIALFPYIVSRYWSYASAKVPIQIIHLVVRAMAIKQGCRSIAAKVSWSRTRIWLINCPPYASGWKLFPEAWISQNFHPKYIPLARECRHSE